MKYNILYYVIMWNVVWEMNSASLHWCLSICLRRQTCTPWMVTFIMIVINIAIGVGLMKWQTHYPKPQNTNKENQYLEETVNFDFIATRFYVCVSLMVLLLSEYSESLYRIYIWNNNAWKLGCVQFGNKLLIVPELLTLFGIMLTYTHNTDVYYS